MSKPAKDVTSLSLYELGEHFIDLFQTLFEDADEDGRSREFEAKFKALSVAFEAKMKACRHVVRMWDYQIATLKDEEKRLAERRKSIEWAKSQVMGRVRGIMESAHMKEVIDRASGLGFKLCKAGGNPSVEITDPDAVPSEFVEFRMETVVDKKAIVEHYKATGVIPEGVTIKEPGHYIKVL